MKSTQPEMTQRYLVLIKIDATNLFNRIKERQNDYIEAFSLKRDRTIFKEIFHCRYQKTTNYDLAHLPMEVIEVTDEFFTAAEELYWYLMNTQDMPTTIEDEIIRKLHFLEKKFELLKLYIDAELGGTSHPEVVDEVLTEFETDAEFGHDLSSSSDFQSSEEDVEIQEERDDS